MNRACQCEDCEGPHCGNCGCHAEGVCEKCNPESLEDRKRRYVYETLKEEPSSSQEQVLKQFGLHG
jgi:hypothetical protein